MNPQLRVEAEIRNHSYLFRGLRGEPGYDFLDQSSFAARLGKERQRAERSGRSFALMLVTVATIARSRVTTTFFGPLLQPWAGP